MAKRMVGQQGPQGGWSGRARCADLEPVGFWAQGGGRGQLEELLLDALHHLVQLRNVLVVRVVQRLVMILKSHNQHTGSWATMPHGLVGQL